MDRKGSLVSELAVFLSGETAAVVGVGNTDRGDDGFGPAVVSLLRQKGAGAGRREGQSLLLIDAGVRPENCLDSIGESGVRRVLFVDAAGGDDDEEGDGGCLDLLDPSQLIGTSVSTHQLPLALVAELLRTETGAQARVLVYRVCGSGRLERFAGLSAGARRAVSDAAAAIRAATADALAPAALLEVGRGSIRHA